LFGWPLFDEFDRFVVFDLVPEAVAREDEELVVGREIALIQVRLVGDVRVRRAVAERARDGEVAHDAALLGDEAADRLDASALVLISAFVIDRETDSSASAAQCRSMIVHASVRGEQVRMSR